MRRKFHHHCSLVLIYVLLTSFWYGMISWCEGHQLSAWASAGIAISTTLFSQIALLLWQNYLLHSRYLQVIPVYLQKKPHSKHK